MKEIVKLMFLAVVLSLFGAAIVTIGQQAPPQTGKVALCWDPSMDRDVTDYVISYGPGSGTYTNTVSVGSGTNCIISNLVVGAIYYFAAQAVDSLGLMSDYSNEVVYNVPLSTNSVTPPTGLFPWLPSTNGSPDAEDPGR